MSADAAFWDNIAETYAAKPVENPDAFDRKTDVTLSHLTPESAVLDVGCGTGSFVLRLAPHVRHAHGLDFAPNMVRIAADKAVDVSNTTFHTGILDDSFTAIGDGQLDMLCAYSLLHLVKDRPAALSQMFRRLKPGGVFVSSTVCLGEGWLPYSLILWVMQRVGKAPFVTVVRTQTIIQEMTEAGFVDVNVVDVGAAATTAFIVARKP